jgi:glycosyltransferase involved in cell wall biosynthesis
VEYLGYVSEHDRQRVYAGARLLVLPSFEEGFGMPALEAMSLGIPVIATRCGALPELVGDEAGVLIDPTEPESIVAALDRVLGDDSMAEVIGRRGLERSRRFRWQHTADAVHDAFREAIEERTCRRLRVRNPVF